MRNEERLGTSLEETNQSRKAASPPLQQIQQGLLSFPNPTEIVELPSGGEYYTEGHPLHGKDTIEIKMMTAKEEDILLNESYLRKGLVVDKLLESVLIDKSIKLVDLLIGDKNAILFATRVTGLGSDYTANVTCGFCGTVAQEEYDLTEFKNKEITIPADVEKTGTHTFLVTLPSTNFKVEFRLLTGKTEKIVTATTAKRKKHKLPQNRLITTLEQMVVAINEVVDRTQISRCLQILPAKDVRYLRKRYELVCPDMDLNYTQTCSSCEKEQEVTLPMTANFFWSNN